MGKIVSKIRYSSKPLENFIFGMINDLLSWLAGKTKISRIIFDIYGRILPIPQTIVRGVPIKVIIPLNQIGVFNTVKSWESREPEVLDWIDSFEKGCTFFDIGASFGTETLYAALKKDGPEKIVAFDLSLQSSFNLAYNISLNNITNVDQYYLALSNGLKLISYAEPSQYYFVKGKEKYDQVSYNVLAISLDRFVEMTGITPNYIKIDVDGAEENLILGMSETVRKAKLKSVVIEVSDQSESAASAFFQKAGFSLVYERLLGEEDHLRFKNLIFSRSKLPEMEGRPSTAGQ
jgi:FkbM family methyltransferase